jgi:hypothetical protein
MKEDETAITQDDSGLLHAATIARYADTHDKPVENVYFNDFREWALENELEFVVGSKEDFRWLQRRIVNGDINTRRAAELCRALEEQEGIEDEGMRVLLDVLHTEEADN